MKKLCYSLFFVVFTTTSYADSIGPNFEKPDVTASVLVANGVHFGQWAKKQNSNSNWSNEPVNLMLCVNEVGGKGPKLGKCVTNFANLKYLNNQMIVSSFHNINFGEYFKYFPFAKLPSNVQFKFGIYAVDTGKKLYSCSQNLYIQSIHANAHYNVALQLEGISNPRCHLITEAVE